MKFLFLSSAFIGWALIKAGVHLKPVFPPPNLCLMRLFLNYEHQENE